MNLYRKFVDGLVMNGYNNLTEGSNGVMFSPSYEMSGIRTAVKIMVLSLIVFIVLLPIDTAVLFIWLFLCAYVYKTAVESKMNNGYPYLEVGSVLGLFINYLIMIPIAVVVYFVFSGGYRYLADLADLNQMEGFIVRVSILFIAWTLYMFLFRDDKWDNRNKEWPDEFIAQDQEIKKEKKEKMEKNGSYGDFVNSLSEKFTLPKDIKDVEQIKDPVISKKRLENFIEWANTVSNNDRRKSNLVNSINENNNLEITIPELSVSITKFNKEDDALDIDFLDESNPSIYMIVDANGTNHYELSDNRKWITAINNSNVTYDVCDDIYGEYGWTEFDSYDEEFYLKEGDFRIPDDMVGYGANYSDDPQTLYCVQEVYFWEKDININGGKFRFKKGDKEHLITLLIASYKPSLLKRIKEGLR